MNVFLKDNKSKIDNEKLNIVFKYDVFEKQEQSEGGNSLKQGNIEYEFKNPTLKLKVKPMQRDGENVNASYSIRVIPQDNAHEEEILDSISLYQFENEYIYNKVVDSDVDEIEIVIDDFPSNKAFYYVTVFATALDSKECLAYDLITIGNNNGLPHEVSTKFRVMMFILFGAIGVLVLVLVIVIIRMKKQNAALEDEVEVLKFNFDDDSDKKGKGKKVSLLGKDEE